MIAIIYARTLNTPRSRNLQSALEREFPYARFRIEVENGGEVVCDGESDATNIDLMRAFAAGFMAACKVAP